MGERHSLENGRSLRLPPPEAWKKPDKWMDLRTGLPLKGLPKIVLPTDDRGFINPDQAIEMVKDMLFWEDYDWPYTPGDPRTAPDDHHFYYDLREYLPEQNDGSLIPFRFRNLAINIGTIPRQVHNTLHDYVKKTDKPLLDAMEERVSEFLIVHHAFSGLIFNAKKITEASHRFTVRKMDLMSGALNPKVQDDILAQEIMRGFFARHFEAYSRSVEEVKNVDHTILAIPDATVDEIDRYKPHVVVKKLGKYVSRSTINYTPLLRGN